ncbi:hypothetical protein [Rhodopirellula islandica]|uniref:hypothetical protein n=1 Tax=Rhodopirellula islandica TaxID=595434 RepID=UPI0012374A43|nr:hypothetical protein [Rhodopirellula islandica]
MTTPPRADEAGGLHHVLNHGHRRAEIFHQDAAHYHTRGMGPVYQQRDNSFPIQDDEHFLVVCRHPAEATSETMFGHFH